MHRICIVFSSVVCPSVSYCCVVLCIFCIVLCIVCMYMCTVQLPPGGYPIAVKYIYISSPYLTNSTIFSGVGGGGGELLNTKCMF